MTEEKVIAEAVVLPDGMLEFRGVDGVVLNCSLLEELAYAFRKWATETFARDCT